MSPLHPGDPLAPAPPGPEEPVTGSYFVSTYPPFSTWDAAGAEEWRRALQRTPTQAAPPGLGLYAHVPFCVERCRYCYYLSYDQRPGDLQRYVDAVLAEVELLRERPAVVGRPVRFAYFGGGTPSLLSVSSLERLLRGIARAFPLQEAQEVSFECAPRTVTERKLALLRCAGVTRISMGVQAMDDAVLAQNGRVHQVADVRRACAAIRAAGFPQWNLDLIVGLVGETREGFLRSLDALLREEPDSVTLYLLEIPLNTPLHQDLQQGGPEPPDWTTKRERLAAGFDRLEAAGYVLRSAYTAVRDPARHRFDYQDLQYHGADLLGIGASSFSYLAGVHHQNRAGLGAYLAALEAGVLPVWRGHALSDRERQVRELLLQLKLGRVDLAAWQARHRADPAEAFQPVLRELEDEGYLERTPAEVRLTRAGLLHVDRLLPRLYLPEHQGVRYS